MTLELTGSRAMTPYFGASIYVWTSIIGIILGSLSLGYFLGGKAADLRPEQKSLALIILVSAIYIGLTAVFKGVILTFLSKEVLNIKISSVVAAIILFAPSSILLGMVSPYAAKIQVDSLKSTGRAVGNLYAISTLGSIVGTFLAGFWLMPLLGNTMMLYACAAALLVAALITSFQSILKSALIFGILLIPSIYSTIFFQKAYARAGFVDLDTVYNHIWVRTVKNTASNRTMRYLQTDAFGLQSVMYVDNPAELAAEYTKMYHLQRHFVPNFARTLMIGGGAFSYPKSYLKTYPAASIDVVEIDPQLTDIAKKYFALSDSPQLKIINEDGRTFLNRNSQKYDAILVDAFKDFTPVPQLATREAVQKMADSLTDNGILITNIVGDIDSQKGQFLRAEYWTIRDVFPRVLLFSASERTQSGIQNYILVALKQDKYSLESGDPEIKDYLSKIIDKTPIKDLPILTDDHAPVENYVLKMI